VGFGIGEGEPVGSGSGTTDGLGISIGVPVGSGIGTTDGLGIAVGETVGFTFGVLVFFGFFGVAVCTAAGATTKLSPVFCVAPTANIPENENKSTYSQDYSILHKTLLANIVAGSQLQFP